LFPIPGNSLIEDFINGKGIGDYIELLAGSQNYEKVQEALNEISHELGNKIQHYRDMLVRLDEYRNQGKKYSDELEKLRIKFAKMPVLDEKEVFQDRERYAGKEKELNQLDSEVASAKVTLRNLDETIADLKEKVKWYEDQVQLIKKRHPRIDARLSEIANELPSKRDQLAKTGSQRAKAQEKLISAQRSETTITKYGEGLCYACGRKLSRDELSAWIRSIKNEISTFFGGNKLSTRDKKIENEQRELKDITNYQYEKIESGSKITVNRKR